jgi:hypothetical protein
MPQLQTKTPPFKPSKDQEIRWESFKGGWNNLFKPTELRPNELAQADNLMLIGEGTPTGRWGSEIYNLAGSTGKIRYLDAYYNSLTSANNLLTITDQGFMTVKSGASYSIVPGASFASGYPYYGVQLGNNTYITGGYQSFIKYSGGSLIPYTAISNPSITSVAMLSYVSGFNTWSWVIDAVSLTGETSPFIGGQWAKSLASLPLDLSKTNIKVQWTAVSAASGVLTGYNVYRGFPGDETYIGSVGPNTTEFIDVGSAQSDTLFPPTSNTTGGPKAKYRLKVDDRIVLANIEGEPSKVLVSGRYPNHDRFTSLDGGGGTFVSPNDGGWYYRAWAIKYPDWKSSNISLQKQFCSHNPVRNSHTW